MFKLSFDRILAALLIFMPVSLAFDLLRADPVLIFASAALAIVPLAGFMGKATEELSKRAGAGIGGFLNATFGNATELIIAIFAINAGLFEVVKASITGAIIGNVLLVMGCAMFFGGLKRKKQDFNVQAQGVNSTMLALAAVGLILPALASHVLGLEQVESLSLGISAVLLITYVCSLIFSLRTHRHLYDCDVDAEECRPKWTARYATIVLVLATLGVALESEMLVGSIGHVSASLGLNDLFIGVIIVAIIGNAAEHSTAVLAAIRNRLDLSIGIAIGSSVQVALFVAPVLVFASHFIGPRPLDLVFTPLEVISIALSTLIIEQITSDGESNWLEGVQLLSVYAILGIVFYFLPA